MMQMKIMQNLTDDQKKKLYTCGLFMLLLPFYEPVYFDVCVPLLDGAFNMLKVVSLLIIALMSLRDLIKTRKISLAAVTLIAMEAWVSVDVFMHQGIRTNIILMVSYVLGICALIEFQVREHARELLSAFLLVNELVIVANLITMLLFPGGLYYTPMQGWDNWFLGYRNGFINIFAPALALELLNSRVTGKRLRFLTMLAVCAISMVLCKSKTGLLGILAFLAIYATGIYGKRWCNGLTVAMTGLAAFFAIVVFKLQSLFQPVFDLLGRNVTFTGRTGIWSHAIDWIKQSPWVGYGLPAEEELTVIFDNTAGVSAHNFILDHLFCYGVVGFALMAVFFGLSVWALYQNRHKPHAAAINLGMVCFQLEMLMEALNHHLQFYVFIFLACHVKAFIDQMPEKPYAPIRIGKP